MRRQSPLTAGEELELTIRFENRLAPGRYFATPIVASESDAELMDLREHFVTVLVTGNRRSGGMVDMQHEIGFARVDRAPIRSGAKDVDGDA